MVLRRLAIVFLAGVVPVLMARSVLAESYQGWGDTGWEFDNKRDCCEEAVWLAQEDSARLCEMSGGHPRIRSGSARGLCDWDSRGSGYDRLYRCTARADVYCR